MLKLLIISITIQIFLLPHTVQSGNESPLQPRCRIYKYKRYEVRKDVIKNINSNKRMSELSLTGTHESMSYKITDLKFQTQDLNITEQLLSGVRFLDVSVRFVNTKLKIFTRLNDLNHTLDDLFNEVNTFIDKNDKELVIINLKYDDVKEDDRSRIFSNHLHNCEIFEHDYPRLIRQWILFEAIGNYRGKILLSTTEIMFSQCMFFIENNCLLSNKISVDNIGSDFDNYPLVNYKWLKYKILSKDVIYDNYACYMYDLSVYDNNILFSRGFTQDGGYYNYSGTCIEPINYRIAHQYSGTRHLTMTIILVDYVTQEIIDVVNSFN